MMQSAFRALLATVVLAVLTGLVYPLVMTGFAQVTFSGKANGSLIEDNGRVVGSSLIGQEWTGAEWFHGRPSATSTPYDGSASSGSNLGPRSQALADAIKERVAAIVELEAPYHQGLSAAGIPADLLTASSSGLDPHISQAAAMFQAPRIAATRDLPLDAVERLVREHTSGRTLGVLGQPRVNVLELNIALQQLSG